MKTSPIGWQAGVVGPYFRHLLHSANGFGGDACASFCPYSFFSLQCQSGRAEGQCDRAAEPPANRW